MRTIPHRPRRTLVTAATRTGTVPTIDVTATRTGTVPTIDVTVLDEDTRTRGHEDMRAGGQEDRRTGGHEDMRTRRHEVSTRRNTRGAFFVHARALLAATRDFPATPARRA